MLSRFKYRKIQVDITTLFLSLLILSSGVIIGYGYKDISGIVLRLSRNVIESISEKVSIVLDDVLKDFQRVTAITASLVSGEVESSSELYNEKLVSYLQTVLEENPNMDAAFIGLQDGNFLGIQRVYENATYRADPSKPLPTEVRYSSLLVNGTDWVWSYLDAQGNVLGEERTPPAFDVTTRPWYVDAKNSGKFTWSPIYTLIASGKPGITASVPILDAQKRVLGVVGMNLSLENISTFLSEQKIGKSGKAIVLTQGGKILIAPEGISHNDKRFSAAYQEYSTNLQNNFTFNLDGIQYLASFVPFPSDFQWSWIVSIVVPVNDFLGAFIQSQEHVILICLAILILAAIIAIYSSKKISQPIIKLSAEVEKIRHLDLKGDIAVKSTITEVHLMATALGAMKTALRSFGRYVPKQIVLDLIREGREIHLGGEKREVTLFFSDIANFTTIAESLPAETLLKALAEYFDGLSQIILKLEGTIDKYIGDNIMAYWGAPSRCFESDFRACASALLCQKYLSEMNQKWRSEGKAAFETRIGIHRGSVIAGNIGTEERMNYTVIGDAVNLASRLEGVNRFYKTKICISEEVYAKVQSLFLARPLDIVSVKGKEKGGKIFELLAQYEGSNDIKASTEQIDLCARFSKAFELYQKKSWQESLQLFQAIQKDFPSDFPTQMYIERCSNLLQHPPENWDGVTHLIQK